MPSSATLLGNYPHHEARTQINREFIIPALPEYTEDRKRHAIQDDPYHHSIENSGTWGVTRITIPRRMGKELFVIDSNPMAGYEYDHERRLQSKNGSLGAPTVVRISLARLYALLDPHLKKYARLGHAAEAVESSKLSIPARTHRILMLGLLEYNHWDSILANTRHGGVLTYDALLRAIRRDVPVENPLYTPGDPDVSLIRDRTPKGRSGKIAKSSARIDRSMRPTT